MEQSDNTSSNDRPQVSYRWLDGITYQEAWDLQTRLHKDLIALKRSQRDLPLSDRLLPMHHLLLCEHSPVYTLGKSGSLDHLLLSEDDLAMRSIEYYKINRGGDITYHGPGQITGYPILDLDYFFTDVHKYVRLIEQAIIDVLEEYDLIGDRLEGYTGVWLRPDDRHSSWRKICAIGVHLSRWVTMHGFALNVNTDLSYFKNIIPCGIQDDNKEVTSMAAELGGTVDMQDVCTHLKDAFARLFDYQYTEDI